MSVRSLPEPISPYGIPIIGEFFIRFLNDPTAGFDEEHFSAELVDVGVVAILGLKKDTRVVVALLFERQRGWTQAKVNEWLGEHPEYLPGKLGEMLAKYQGKKILRLLRSPAPFIDEFLTLRAIDESDGIYSISGVTADSSVPQVVALIFNGDHWDEGKVSEWLQTRQGDVYSEEW